MTGRGAIGIVIHMRRDLLEDLLAGRAPIPGPRLSAARAAGLDSAGRCLLIAAVPVSPAEDDLALRSAASALARAVGGVLRPLTVVRQDEIVIVRAVGTEDPRRLTEPVERAQRELTDVGVRLAIGISTTFDTTGGLPEAYREACAALESLPPGRRGDVAAAANLNAKVTAQRLYIHVNTAHHRLARIEEKTGCDLRDLGDVQELLIAIRRARHPIRATTAAG